MRSPSAFSRAACSARRVSTQASHTVARCAASRLPIEPAPNTHTRSIPAAGASAPAAGWVRSAGTGQLPELLVADQAVLACAERLDLREQLGPVLLGAIDPQLGELDPDRVEPALLAQDDPARRADKLGGERLDRRRVVELAGHGAALAREQRLARERLPRLKLVARGSLHELGHRPQALEMQASRNSVQRLEGERHLAQVGVAGPLA